MHRTYTLNLWRGVGLFVLGFMVIYVFGVLNNLQYYSLLNYIKTQIRKTGEPKDKRKDGSISIKVGGLDLDLRVNIMPALLI